MSKTKEKSIKKIINEFDEKEDINGLDKLYKEVLTSGSVVLKQALAEAYLSIMFVYSMDYACGKIEGEETVFDMLKWIDKAEKLTPKEPFNAYRGSSYELLANQEKQPKEKKKYINKAIDQYENWIKKSPKEFKAYTELAEAILEKNIILKRYKPIDFEQIISLFSKSVEVELKTLETEKGYYLYDNSVAFTSFLFASYKIATLTFDQSLKTHQHFLTKFKRLAAGYLEKDSFYYYTWVRTLGRIVDYNKYVTKHKNYRPLSKNTIIEIQKEIEDKLSHITSYISTDENKLCNLGHIFHNFAKDKKSLKYHTIALNYFLKAKVINPYTWTYPVYATNVLKNMALLHVEKANIKEAQTAFKTGKEIFEAAAVTVGEDFTLFNYYGKFLYAYAKHIEHFTNKSLLEETQQIMLVAKRLGKNFYDDPYIYLAKAALKLGNKHKCLQILEDCYHTFSNEYSNYDFKRVQKSKDFDELKNSTRFQDLLAKRSKEGL